MNIQEALRLNERGELPTGYDENGTFVGTTFFYENLVPKTLQANLVYRKRILELGYENREYARQFYQMAARDVLWYVNTFWLTLNTKEYPKQPVRPFITYPYQDSAILTLQRCIGHEDVWITKSRDMGASWICLLVHEHLWHFHENQLFGLSSEKQELVDGPSEKTLMKKLDWVHKRLPVWMMPQRVHRVKNHYGNLDTHSAFDGEATVEHLGTGDRRTSMLLDEFSKNEKADKILTSTRDVTRSRVINSTPNGRGGVGAPFYEMGRNPHVQKIFMHWSEHPEKSKGLYRIENGEKKSLDPRTYRWQDDYDFKQLKFVGEKARSPWYDKQCQRAQSLKEIAQELDMDFHGSAEIFADPEVMNRVLQQDVQPPKFQGRLGVDPDTLEATWRAIPDGPFKLWCPLIDGRPPRSEYSVGIDISAGTGGQYSSNSSIVVWDKKPKVVKEEYPDGETVERVTYEQVARFAINTMRPEPFARYCIGVCQWFWDAQMIPEVNGGLGQTFLNEVKEHGYWNVYRRNVEMIGDNEKTEKIGYFHKDAGAAILGSLMDAMGQKKAIVRDEMIVAEFLEYEYLNGKPHHAGAKRNDSEADKGMTHGDVAIAAGCSWLGVKDVPAEQEKEEFDGYPPGSLGWRLEQLEREAQMAESTWDSEW